MAISDAYNAGNGLPPLMALEALLEEGAHPIGNLANTAACLWEGLPDINWVGFYLLDQGALWLGPFAGRPACMRIERGRGVCGTALMRDETLVVPDVHDFPGHIACDAASRAEIVVPLHARGRPIGVLDVDSPLVNRFTQDDRALLERCAGLLEQKCDWSRLGYDLRAEEG